MGRRTSKKSLPVLDRRLYNGGNGGGEVPCAELGIEASADLELGLC